MAETPRNIHEWRDALGGDDVMPTDDEFAPAEVPDEDDEPAPGEPAAPAASPAAAAEVSTAATPPAGEPPPAAAAPPPEAPKPFSWRVDRTEIAPPSAVRRADGKIEMTAEDFDRYVIPNSANRAEWQRERQALIHRLEQTRDELDPEKNDTVITARVLTQKIDELEKLGPEGVEKWAEGFIEQLPQLRQTAKDRIAAARIRQLEGEKTEREETEAAAERARTFEQSLRNHVQSHVRSDAYKDAGLNEDEVFNRLWKHRRTLFTVADRDYENGVRRGQAIIDPDLFYDTLDDMAKVSRAERRAADVDEVRARANAERLKPTTTTPATTADVAPAARGRRTGDRPEPKSLREWRKALS